MSDNTKNTTKPSEAPAAPLQQPKKLKLQVKELTLKQAPMEAVIDRET